MYKVKDYKGEAVVGSFPLKNYKVLTPKQDRIYKVEKFLNGKGKGRRKRFLIKWLGWPGKFNNWMEASQLYDI